MLFDHFDSRFLAELMAANLMRNLFLDEKFLLMVFKDFAVDIVKLRGWAVIGDSVLGDIRLQNC
jgi:hypothetical protein